MMVGSPAVAAAAQFGVWVLLALGAGYLVLPRLSPYGGLYVTTWIAVLDIALVLLVFKKDIKLS